MGLGLKIFPKGKNVKISECLKKIAARPCIGIFWVINDEVIAFPNELVELSEVAGFKDSPYDHIRVWNTIRSQVPTLRNVEYEVERGRVTYHVDKNKFLVLFSTELSKKKNIKSKILREFSIPSEKVEFSTDIHYTLPKNLKNIKIADM